MFYFQAQWWTFLVQVSTEWKQAGDRLLQRLEVPKAQERSSARNLGREHIPYWPTENFQIFRKYSLTKQRWLKLSNILSIIKLTPISLYHITKKAVMYNFSLIFKRHLNAELLYSHWNINICPENKACEDHLSSVNGLSKKSSW